MIASLYECDIDAEAWKFTTAEHIKLLLQYKLNEKKNKNATTTYPKGSSGDNNNDNQMAQILNIDGGRWGNIPIFYAVYYSARLSVIKFMFENNKPEESDSSESVEEKPKNENGLESETDKTKVKED